MTKAIRAIVIVAESKYSKVFLMGFEGSESRYNVMTSSTGLIAAPKTKGRILARLFKLFQVPFSKDEPSRKCKNRYRDQKQRHI